MSSVGESYLLKEMHYNIALLPKKVSNLCYFFLQKVMRCVNFALLLRYFLNMSRAWLFVFNIKIIFIAIVKALSNQKV